MLLIDINFMNTSFYNSQLNNNDNNQSLNLNYKDNNQSTKFEYKDTYNSYYLSIRDNNTDIFKEIYLTESEFNIIKTAIKYNNGIINLLGHKEEVFSLYRKGLIKISNDELKIAVVSDLILKLLSPKVLENRNILLSYNKDIHSNKYNKEENKELGLDFGINNPYKTINSINSINSLFDGDEDEYLLEENRPNSIFKIFDNLDVCFCCLL